MGMNKDGESFCGVYRLLCGVVLVVCILVFIVSFVSLTLLPSHHSQLFKTNVNLATARRFDRKFWPKWITRGSFEKPPQLLELSGK